MAHGLNMLGAVTTMVDFVTYLAKIGNDIDLNHVSQKISTCGSLKGDKICGMHEEFHITFFRDGEIWVEVPGGEDQSRQLMRVAQFLSDTFTEQGISVDFTNLLLNARAVQGSVSPHLITHTDPSKYRPRLGSGVNINFTRLMLHWVLFNELGERWKEIVKQFGRDVGALAYASMAESIKDEKTAFEGLKKFMQKNGVGIMQQITPKAGDVMRIMIDESLTSSGFPDLGRRLCYLESGIIEGFFSKLYGKSILCEEERCWSLGNDHCEFSVTVEENAE
jgi:predicted hydrocarbon binding protein